MNRNEYDATMRRIEALWDAPLNAAQEMRYEQWITDAVAYEREHFGIRVPSRDARLVYWLDSRGWLDWYWLLRRVRAWWEARR